MEVSGGLMLVLVLFGLFGMLGLFIKSRYKIVKPNEALLIAGTRRRAEAVSADAPAVLKVVRGGGVLVWPFIQQAFSLSLETMRMSVDVQGVPTKNKVTVNLDSTANVRIGSSEEEINKAGMRFLSWEVDEIVANIIEVLAGSVRAILGKMTVEEIIENRETFARAVQDVASKELAPMGLVIDVMNIKEISDKESYIHNLGVPQVEAVRKGAEIAKYEASLEITKTEQGTEEQKALFTRDAEVKKAEYLAETERAQRVSEQAGPLAEAEARKQVVTEETQVAKLQAVKTEEELVAQVKKPADAAAYEARVSAEGNRDAAIADAEGEKQRLQMEGEGNAAKSLSEGRATAEIAKIQGLAEAEAQTALAKAEGAEILEVALARAEGIQKEAEALNAMNDASMGLKQLEIMPEMVREAASQVQSIDGLVLAGGSGLETFLTLLPRLIEQVSEVVKVSDVAVGGNGHRPGGVSTPSDIASFDGAQADDATSVIVESNDDPAESDDANTASERSGIVDAFTSALSGIEGEDLADKLFNLRKRGGPALESAAGSETLDDIIALAETVAEGTLEQQVAAALDMVDVNPALREKVYRALPLIERAAPFLKSFKDDSTPTT